MRTKKGSISKVLATGHSIGSVSVESVTAADGLWHSAPPTQGWGVDTVPLPPLHGWGSHCHLVFL